MIEKVVSGGQTGADRSALDLALELGIETGGWVPRGRRAEDGKIPERYPNLVETESETYEVRTELNVRDSDATLVLSFGPPTGGTALTVGFAGALGRPHLVLDLDRLGLDEASARLRGWLGEARPQVLNVAGPRASKQPRIVDATAAVLRGALSSNER